jgi:DNA-binding transcriptional LysR family regulator
MLAPIHLRNVRSLKLITPLPHHEISRAVLHHLKASGIAIERVMYLDGYAATIEMLRNSDWSTITALSVVFREIEVNSVNVHPLLKSDLTYSLCLVHALRTTLSPAAERFVDLMQQAFTAYTDSYRKILNKRERRR